MEYKVTNSNQSELYQTVLSKPAAQCGEVKNPVAVTPTPMTPALELFLTVPPLVTVPLPSLMLSRPLKPLSPFPTVAGLLSIEMMLLVFGIPNNPRPPVHPLPLRAAPPALERTETDGARYDAEANPIGMSDGDEK